MDSECLLNTPMYTALPVLLGDNVGMPSHINNIQGIKWYTEETTAGRHRELVSRRP